MLQVVAWGWMLPTMGVAQAESTLPWLICTADGLKVVAADATSGGGNGPEEAAEKPSKSGSQDGDHAAGHCPLCPLVAGLALPPPPTLVHPLPMTARDPRLLPGERIAAGWFLSTLQARAPPAAV
ncbi:DUF2946 family protein [Azospirillum picis]|uniref:DUF2946 domain-containing protein n=1 Tax=Azospirillum picis TaxID=488438 RepID=A0ABU0MHQ2_9PROT|nr:DUF2946 family protein [Azospirillum picis]MBP2299017.1 hypothetical protein [Azospirillum picis]MDQ0532741.1 hypothetical protein [Azospirillum picis]